MTKQSRKKKIKPKTRYNKKAKSKAFSYYSVCSLIVLASLTFFNLSSYFSPPINQVVLGNQASANNYTEQKNYWGNILSENPDYINGWLELAKLEYKQGNSLGAKQALDNAKSIDPNSDRLEEITKNLSL